MNLSAVRHLSFYPFVQPIARDKARFVLEGFAGDLAACELVWWRRSLPDEQHRACLSKGLSNGAVEQWQAEVCFPEEIHYIKYAFCLTDNEGKQAWFNSYGMNDEFNPSGSFELLQVNATDVLSVPDWAKGCIFYQIFPERFHKTGPACDGLDPWDAAPTRENFLGGNLRGIIEKLPWLSELGVECLYLNPIFEGDYNHKYATTDYLKIDPAFGTEADLIELVEKAHSLGIRVILDGVFNHCGIHFPPFVDLLENGEASRFRDWFYPRKYPVEIDAKCYECVGDYPYMPRLNGESPEVREYVEKVLLYWLERAHIDGWRFDVADELDRHAVTRWREAVKRAFPDALLLCETWGDASRLLGPDGLDSAMNYLFRDAMVDFFAHSAMDAKTLKARLDGMLMRYPREINHAQYNLIGSHDTARFLTEAKGEKWRLKLAMAFQMLFPGAPAVYYGDEIGMTGENDPGCRGGMAWGHQDTELLQWQKDMIWLRKRHPALRLGSYRALAAKGGLFAFERKLGDDHVAAFFNASDTPEQLDFAETGETVHIPPRSVKIIEV